MPKNRIKYWINALQVENEEEEVSQSILKGMVARGMQKDRYYQIRANLRQPNTRELLEFLKELRVYKSELTMEDLLDSKEQKPADIKSRHNLLKD
ncbi:MAG: hypothetical protein ACYC1Q_10335 [Bacteroidia bacterium]